MLKYLKRAFTNRWNLLAFLGGTGFALLAPATVVILPLVIAGEIAYLGFVGANPRYQRMVDSEDTKLLNAEKATSAEHRRNRLMGSLHEDLRRRFYELRRRCLEIRRIATELRHPDAVAADAELDEMQIEGLDRLLWIYLRLLYTKQSLDRFLAQTSEDSIQQDINKLNQRLERIRAEEDAMYQDKLILTVEDNLATCNQRLANFRQAKGSHELLELEIDRLENKIQTISEMAINRAEPDEIVAQVDEVADSMIETEETMNELQFATNLIFEDEVVPKLMVEQQGV